jgi:WD40 repeat protein/tRNA A-37 threonylcarbamoyl transferase component Bud32
MSGQSETPDSSHESPADGESLTIGRYKVESEVAQGGMAIVYRVHDAELDRTLAMKVMTATGQDSSSAKIELARFLEEAQVTAQLDHPGIVPVHETGRDAEGKPFFTMRLVKGRTLSEVFALAREDKEGWNIWRAVGVMVKACQAVAYAHEKGVIHRDLKPANIMVGRLGEVYVMDWGLAKVSGRKDLHDARPNEADLVSESLRSPRYEAAKDTPGSPLVTMDGTVMGTPAYMPPEQASGKVVNHSSDIYSLGAILYSLLTGHAPYVEEDAHLSPYTILARVLHGPPARAQQINPTASPELIAICEKAMARDPTQRFASALEMAEDLQAFLDHRVVRAYRTGAFAELKSWVLRNRAAAILASLTTLLVGIAVFVVLYQQKTAADRLTLEAYAADMKATQVALEQENLGQAVQLLERYTGPHGKDIRGLEWNYLWQAAKGDDIYSWTHPDMVVGARFSPDGKVIATACFDQVLRIWDANSRGLIKFIRRGIDDPVAYVTFCFSPNGRILASASKDGVMLIDTSDWTVTRTLPVFEPDDASKFIGALAYSPDNRFLAIALGAKVKVWDAKNGEFITLETGANRTVFTPDSSHLIVAAGDVEVWNVLGKSKVRSYPGGSAFSVAVSPDGKTLLFGDFSGKVIAWDLTGDRMLWSKEAHRSRIYGLAFSPDGKRFATGAFDQVIRMWDFPGAELQFTLRGHINEIWFLEFSADGKKLVSSGKDGTARIWDAQEKENPDKWRLKVNDALLGYSNDEKTFVTISGDGPAFHHWNKSKFEKTVPLQCEPRLPGRLLFSSRSGLLLGLDTNGAVWRIASDSGKCDVRKFADPILKLERFSPDERFLAGIFGNESGAETLGVWDFSTGQRRASYPKSWTTGSWGDPVAFSRDRPLIAFPGPNYTIEVWDMERGKRLWQLRGHTWNINYSCFSSDGKYLASCGWDDAVRIWSLATGKLVVPPLRGHGSGVGSVSFSSDAKTLITGGDDYTVRFWNVPTGREMLLLRDVTYLRNFPAGPEILSPSGEHLLMFGVNDSSLRFQRIRAVSGVE